ncbi:MAG: 2-hydroxyacyl-CoA dehydratase family protein [Verrucomicrobia bacterium]|nr:2-hydroxyacyl-CoA dehydratase family protein [Verrucomicrobiota bacterium]
MMECSNTNNNSNCPQSCINSRFDSMIENCCEYAERAREAGKPIIGIMCEYTPRELIMAAGGIPVCLCGGSEEKIAPAENDLPTALCPLIKSTYGYCCTQTNPFLEMSDLLVAETTCDGKKKMYELMARRKDMMVLELPQKPDAPHAMDHWLSELRRFRSFLETRYDRKIADAGIWKAIETMNLERALRRRLAEMNKQTPSVWSGLQLLAYKSIISGIDEDLEEYRRLIACGANAAGSEKQSCVRVLLTGVPTVHGAERVVEIIENAGGAVVCMENCTGIKPLLEDVSMDASDPMEALASKYMHLPCSVMTPNTRRLEILRRLADEYDAECVIELVWQGCLTYDVESYYVRQIAEEMSLPYLKLVTDYSPSDSARIALRVEALMETALRAQA